MILTDCPQCGQELRIADKYAGQTGRCDKCGAAITVPGSSLMVAPTEGHATSLLIDCPDCGHAVSKRANACPRCGAPVHSGVGVAVQTIELTSKRLKFLVLIGFLIMFAGLTAAVYGEIGIGILAVMVGVVWWFVARVMIWWHHE